MFPKFRKSFAFVSNTLISRRKYAIPALGIAGCALAGAAVQSNFQFSKKVVETSPNESDNIPNKSPEDIKAILPYLSDQVFETTDDMLVFTFPSEERFARQLSKVRSIMGEVSKADIPKVKMFFAILPARDPAAVADDKLEVMCYKGQRKLRSSIRLDAEAAPIDEWREFFKFKASPVDEELKDCVIEHVAGDEFKEKILESKSPVLLQVYEKSCFLCFLMRPFLNSLAAILDKSGEVDFKIKRLDIEENDFPEGLPVVRGTPTFVLFSPREGGRRLEEFKPRDLVKRLCKDYPLSSETQQKLDVLVDKIALRFQAFSALVMWGTESEKMLELLSHPDSRENVDQDDKEMFNKIVSEYMADDMLRIDSLDQNIKSVMRELNHMERHALMLGQVLGDKIVALEKMHS